jgi:hypothetical protein
MNRRDFLKLVAFLPFTAHGSEVQAYRWSIKGGTRKQLQVIAALRTIGFPFSRISRDIPDPTIECVPNLMSSDGTYAVTGRFSPSTGKISIKSNQSPESLKMAVVLEMAHLIDYYMPMTDLMRARISQLLHGNNSGVWWTNNHATYASGIPYESAWSPPITQAMMRPIRRILRVPRVRTPQIMGSY